MNDSSNSMVPSGDWSMNRESRFWLSASARRDREVSTAFSIRFASTAYWSVPTDFWR